MRCSESVMTVLENRGLIRKEEAHCIHCGCLWDTANDTSLCLRCRSGFYFSIPAIVTGDGFSKKRCKTGYEGKLLTYRWCEGCQQFHWLRWLYFFFFILVNLETHKQKYFSSIVICIQWLHTESAWSLINHFRPTKKLLSHRWLRSIGKCPQKSLFQFFIIFAMHLGTVCRTIACAAWRKISPEMIWPTTGLFAENVWVMWISLMSLVCMI